MDNLKERIDEVADRLNSLGSEIKMQFAHERYSMPSHKKARMLSIRSAILFKGYCMLNLELIEQNKKAAA